MNLVYRRRRGEYITKKNKIDYPGVVRDVQPELRPNSAAPRRVLSGQAWSCAHLWSTAYDQSDGIIQLASEAVMLALNFSARDRTL